MGLCEILVYAESVSVNSQTTVKFRAYVNHLGNLKNMDSIANMLTSIKNAGGAKKESVSIPYSSIKFVIAEKLKQRGFVGNVEKKGKTKPTISIEVLYDENGRPRITDVDRLSKLSRRLYKGYREIRPVRRGHGVLLVSTPKGVLTGEEAVKEKVGGEVLCTIW